jgi:hypothetical protein
MVTQSLDPLLRIMVIGGRSSTSAKRSSRLNLARLITRSRRLLTCWTRKSMIKSQVENAVCSTDCNHQHRPQTPIMLIGNAGTSARSKIRGHARRAAEKWHKITVVISVLEWPMNTMHHRHVALASTQLSIPGYASLSKVLGKLWRTMARHYVTTRIAQHTQLGANSRNRDVQVA